MELVKIHFRLSCDEDGYPPVAVESLWGKVIEEGVFQVDSIPFFVCDATLEDVVSATKDANGFWFNSIISKSKNSLLRVVFFDPGYVDVVKLWLIDAGCSTEYLREHSLMSVNIPPEVPLQSIQQFMKLKTEANILDYEEALIRHAVDKC